MPDTHTTNTKWATTLTLAGTLPFLGAIGLSLSEQSLFGVTPEWLARSYGAVIASFLCGIHWALYLITPDKCRLNLFVLSNAVTLCVWALLWPGLEPALALGGEVVAFLVLLWVDFSLAATAAIPAWFLRLRCAVTGIVCLALIVLIGLGL